MIAYGTNEAFDTRAAERVAEPLRGLVERLRRAAPQADCLVVGPPDAADPERRLAAADCRGRHGAAPRRRKSSAVGFSACAT